MPRDLTKLAKIKAGLDSLDGLMMIMQYINVVLCVVCVWFRHFVMLVNHC